MDAATRRVQRRALEVKAELVAALLDGLAARRDALVAERNAGASAEKVSKYRAENAAERMMRFARGTIEQASAGFCAATSSPFSKRRPARPSIPSPVPERSRKLRREIRGLSIDIDELVCC